MDTSSSTPPAPVDAAADRKKKALSRVGSILRKKYRLENLLGHGGFGAVYRATNLDLDRPCAVKVLHEARPDAVRRFRQEGKTANRIRTGDRLHPNVVDVIDVDSDGELHFLVQELLDGADLAAYLDKIPGRTLPPREAMRIALPICDALALAHRLQIVHRDLKPSNIFMVAGENAIPKLLDFGLARIANPRLTPTGLGVIGTPFYAAPEVLVGDEATASSDVWAVGAILYEMLSGKALREWSTPSHLVGKNGVTPELWAVLARCLRDEPAQRFPQAGPLHAALERVALTPAAQLIATTAFRRVGSLADVLFTGVVDLERWVQDAIEHAWNQQAPDELEETFAAARHIALGQLDLAHELTRQRILIRLVRRADRWLRDHPRGTARFPPAEHVAMVGLALHELAEADLRDRLPPADLRDLLELLVIELESSTQGQS